MNKNSWEENYALAKEYYLKNGNLLVPTSYKTEDGYPLGNWIRAQRKAYKNRGICKEERKNTVAPLSDEKMKLLLDIGMVFDAKSIIYDNNWQKMYNYAKKFYGEHGHLFVPKNYQVEDNVYLDKWLRTQRIAYRNRNIPLEERSNKEYSLTDYQVKLLLEIGMVLENAKEERHFHNWLFMYNLAKNYYNEYHNLLIDYQFTTFDGINYDYDGYKLGAWIVNQRRAYRNIYNSKENRIGTLKPLTEKQIKLLLDIDMIFDEVNSTINKSKWIYMYNLANVYYEVNGNLLVPIDFETINGFEYNERGVNLGTWVRTQKLAYKNRFIPKEERKNNLLPLTDWQVDLLSKIGIDWNYQKVNKKVMILR